MDIRQTYDSLSFFEDEGELVAKFLDVELEDGSAGIAVLGREDYTRGLTAHEVVVLQGWLRSRFQ